MYYEDVKIKLGIALNRLITKYSGNPETTSVQANKSGSYQIQVGDGPTLWFADEMELGGWVLENSR